MAEQAGFQVTPIEERDDLVLADTKQVWTPGSVGAAAERAAIVAKKVLDIDKQEAIDAFTGQLEAMGITEVPEGLIPIASVTVVEGNGDQAIKPTHVIKGHDALTTKDGAAIPETDVWPHMYAIRHAAWWNKTRPDGESQLAQVPLRLVLADTALRGTGQKWDKQQLELHKLIKGHSSDATALEGMTPLDWMMLDADAIIGDTDRPDTPDAQTITRFVQHEKDRFGGGVECGPRAYVVGNGQAYLTGSDDSGIPNYGFRAVMGQKQAS